MAGWRCSGPPSRAAPGGEGTTARPSGSSQTEWVKALQVRDRTRYHYKVNLDKWIKPTFGTVPMSAVTPAMVRKWVGGFPSDTPAARANAYRVLSQVFRAAVEDGIVTESPREGP